MSHLTPQSNPDEAVSSEWLNVSITPNPAVATEFLIKTIATIKEHKTLWRCEDTYHKKNQWSQ